MVGNRQRTPVEALKYEKNQQLLSLDDESIITNVPIHTSINIIANKACNCPTILTPNMNADFLQDFLNICTIETIFLFKSDNYFQCDEDSMRSPLGPTFAGFYMRHVGSNLLSQNMIFNPIFYVRYIDDILTKVNSTILLIDSSAIPSSSL